MATHASVLAWRTPGTGSHRVGQDCSDLAVAVSTKRLLLKELGASQWSPLGAQSAFWTRSPGEYGQGGQGVELHQVLFTPEQLHPQKPQALIRSIYSIL